MGTKSFWQKRWISRLKEANEGNKRESGKIGPSQGTIISSIETVILKSYMTTFFTTTKLKICSIILQKKLVSCLLLLYLQISLTPSFHLQSHHFKNQFDIFSSFSWCFNQLYSLFLSEIFYFFKKLTLLQSQKIVFISNKKSHNRYWSMISHQSQPTRYTLKCLVSSCLEH